MIFGIYNFLNCSLICIITSLEYGSTPRTAARRSATNSKNKIADIKKTDAFKYIETFGNENSNGNALYCLLSGDLNG